MRAGSERVGPLGLFPGKPPPRLQDSLIEAVRVRHCRRRTVEELSGHKDVRTTMTYRHVPNRGGRAVRSPADVLTRQPDDRY